MRIVFMGTPDFAVPSMNILADHGFEIVGVVTAPDKPGGRMGVQESAVKKAAQLRGIKILQPLKLKAPEFLAELQALKADLQVVVAFRMLPEVVWNMPPLGTLNLHGSLLPKYRGAAPINWAVINGEKETGVTTFFLQHEIDTGDIIMQRPLPIGPDDTAGEIHDRMMTMGAGVVLETVQAIANGTVTTHPQHNSAATHAPKIFTSTCEINPQNTAQQVHNFIRGLSPFPGAWMIAGGRTFKILKSKMSSVQAPVAIGKLFEDGKNSLFLAVKGGALELLEVQIEGKKRMTVKEFLNGHRAMLQE